LSAPGNNALGRKNPEAIWLRGEEERTKKFEPPVETQLRENKSKLRSGVVVSGTKHRIVSKRTRRWKAKPRENEAIRKIATSVGRAQEAHQRRNRETNRARTTLPLKGRGCRCEPDHRIGPRREEYNSGLKRGGKGQRSLRPLKGGFIT